MGSCQLDYEEFEQSALPKQPDEIYGKNSMCINTRLTDGYMNGKCLKMACVFEAEVQVVEVEFKNGTKVYCRKDGELIEYYDQGEQSDGVLQCPRIRAFCDQVQAGCPNNCNNLGICLEKNRCFCMDDRKGKDCIESLGEEEKRFRDRDQVTEAAKQGFTLASLSLVSLLLLNIVYTF